MSEANTTLTMTELAKTLEEGTKPLHELKGIRLEEMEAVYALAHDFYQTGRYEDAETLFRFLTMFDHQNEKFWMGYAAVEQVLRHYDRAIAAYAYVCVVLDVHNVKAAYYAAECYLAKGDRTNAQSSIDFVKEYADVKTEMGRTFLAKAKNLQPRVEALPESVKEG